MLFARAERFHQFAGDVFRDAQRIIFLFFSFERGAANRIDRLALLVHHVVVFEQVFARLEVLRFDGLLRVFDAPRNQLGLDGHALGHAQAVHQRLDALAAEHAQQIVFERKEKARGARVALAAGASAKLVVDAPRFVALGAEDVQAAEGDHFIVLRVALLGELVVDRLPLIGGHLKNLAFLLEQNHRHGRLRSLAPSAPPNHGGRRGIGNRQFVLQAIIARHRFGIAAQQNVRAAAGHVGGDRDRAFAPGLRDDLLRARAAWRSGPGAECPPSSADSAMSRIFRSKSCPPARAGRVREIGGCRAQGVVFLQDAVDHGFVFFRGRAVDHVGKFIAEQTCGWWESARRPACKSC